MAYWPYKKFDQQQHDRDDSRTREAFSGMLTANGCGVLASGQFDTDLSVCRPNGTMLDLDAEIRHLRNWGVSGEFPFATMQFGLRRREKLKNCPENYVLGVSNDSLTSWIAVSGCVLAEHGREVSKIVNGQLDWFLEIDLGYCLQGTFPHVA